MAMAAIGRAARSTGKAPAVFPARIRRVLTSREPKNSRRTDERAFGPAAYAPRWGRDELRREREAGGCHVLVIARSRNSGNLNAAGGVIPSRALSGGAVECAPGGGQLAGRELTGTTGLSEDESHGPSPHPQH